MKLTKRDCAQVLGMTYHGTRWEFVEYAHEAEFHVFEFRGKILMVDEDIPLEQAWEQVAEKLLEPLVDYLLGNLDDE
jgi:hypothetical protein